MKTSSARRRRAWGAHAHDIGLLATPLVAMQLSQVATGTITTILAGRVGGLSLAGIGLGAMLLAFFLVVTNGFFSAAGLAMAEAHAALDDVRGRAVVRVAIRAAAAATIPLALVLVTSARWLVWLGQRPEVAAIAGCFLRAAALGLPGALVFAALRQLAAAAGRPVAPAVLTATGAGVLACLGALLTSAGDDPSRAARLLGWSVAATSTFNAAVMVVLFLRLSRSPLSAREARAARRTLFTVGVPTAAMFASEAGFFAAVALLAGRLGEAALAAHNIAVQISYLTFMVPSGIGMATTIVVAKARTRGVASARRAGLVGIALASGFMSVATVVLVAARQALANAFGADVQTADVYSTACSLLLITAGFQIADGAQGVASAALRGVRRAGLAFIVGTSAYWVTGVGGGALLAFGAGLGVRGLWFGIALGIVVAAAALVTAFVWVTHEVRPAP